MNFWNGPIAGVVKKMKATGNRPGVIAEWKALVETWAQHTNTADADSVKSMLPFWQPRAIYSAAELAPMFPALAIALGVQTFNGRMPPAMSPARLANALEFAGLPCRTIDGQRYFAVERLHYWLNIPARGWIEEISSC